MTIRTITDFIIQRGAHMFHESSGGCGCRSWSFQVLAMLVQAGITIPKDPSIPLDQSFAYFRHCQTAYETSLAARTDVTIADETGAHFAFQARQSFEEWNAYQRYCRHREALEKARSALAEERARRG